MINRIQFGQIVNVEVSKNRLGKMSMMKKISSFNFLSSEFYFRWTKWIN